MPNMLATLALSFRNSAASTSTARGMVAIISEALGAEVYCNPLVSNMK